MTHPTRGMINTRHAYRSIPRRVACRLFNRSGEEIAFVEEVPYRGVSRSEAAVIVNLQNEARTWLVPMVLLPDGVTVHTSYTIREVDTNDLWEVQSVTRSQEMWVCVCVKMNEHGDYVR